MLTRKKYAGILTYCKTFDEVQHENMQKRCAQKDTKQALSNYRESGDIHRRRGKK